MQGGGAAFPCSSHHSRGGGEPVLNCSSHFRLSTRRDKRQYRHRHRSGSPRWEPRTLWGAKRAHGGQRRKDVIVMKASTTSAHGDTNGPGYVPVIDISSYNHGAPIGAACNEAVCNAIDSACREAGFFVVTGHGVPQEVIDSAKRASRQFFSLSQEEKNKIAHMRKGYIPVGGCQNQVRSTQLHEKWSCGRVSGIDRSLDYYAHEIYFGDPNLWPQEPKDFEVAMMTYYQEMEQLSLRLLGLLAVVMGAPGSFFNDKMDRHVTNLVALRYPPQDREPEPGEMRAKPHTDPTVLTILTHDKAPGTPSGLEVLHDSRGCWEPVPVASGGLVVNVGDLLHRWSGGNFRSAKHRVVNGSDDRLAISYFAMPNYDAAVAPLLPPPEGFQEPFETILAGDISHFTQLEREKQGLEDPQVLKAEETVKTSC